MLGDISRALRPAHPTSKSTDHKRWDTEIRMYAGIIRSAVHTTFRRGVTIALVHSVFKPDKACLRGVEKMRPVTPEIKGSDDAIWNRLHLIPFTVTIPKEK